MKPFLPALLFIFIFTEAFARPAYKVEGNNVIVNLEGIGVKSKLLKIELWSPNTVRVMTTMNDQFSPDKCILDEKKEEKEKIKFKAAYAQNCIEITTTGLLIDIEENGLLRLQSRNGRKLLVESDRSFEPSAIENGAFKVTESFYLSGQEHIYGGGQDNQEKRFNLRNQNFNIKQSNTEIASPVIFSEKGYALIWENGSATNFSDSPSVLKLTSESADEISYIFITGQWPTLISEIRRITGKAPLLPKWAYGYHLNPLAFQSKEQVNQTIEKYELHAIPVEKKQVKSKFYNEEKKLTSVAEKGRFQNIWAYKTLKKEYAQMDSTTEKRLAIPTHIDWPGIQKFGTFTIAGDISASWETLNSQISTAITSSFTGQPYWSTTIGGAVQTNNLTPESLNELLIRWYQFAAFTPVFQGPALPVNRLFTATTPDSKPFNAIVKTIQLRYQLLPYIYSTAADVSFNNKAFVRSLLFDFPDDEQAKNIDQQFLFGKSLMICPVTSEGATTESIYLPSGTKWYNFWNGKMTEGGKTLNETVTLNQIPVFVKQGAIIPMEFKTKTDSGMTPQIEVRVYPGHDGQFILYNDEEDGQGYTNGQYSKISIEYTEKNKTVIINAAEGEYPGMPAEKIFKIVLVSEEDGLGTSPAANAREVTYRGKRIKIKFE